MPDSRRDKTRALKQAMIKELLTGRTTIDMIESLCLKTVYDLRVDATDDRFRYYIPAYQRGYRWTPTPMTQLLDELHSLEARNEALYHISGALERIAAALEGTPRS